MAERRCGSQAAFDQLREASQKTNVPLGELATRLVESVNDGVEQDGASDPEEP
jgi:AmiR/NasT family two-component response regulator